MNGRSGIAFSRLWLDATEDDGKSLDSVPIPRRRKLVENERPDNTSASTANITVTSRRENSKSDSSKRHSSLHSLHPPTTQQRASCLPSPRSHNPESFLCTQRPSRTRSHASACYQRSPPSRQHHHKPSSTPSHTPRSSETIISSLIDSISEITPRSPTAPPLLSPSPSRASCLRKEDRTQNTQNHDFAPTNSTAVNPTDPSNYTAYLRQLQANGSVITDAAEPPIVRTAKLPSGFSPLTALAKPPPRRDRTSQTQQNFRSPQQISRRLYLRSSSAGATGGSEFLAEAPQEDCRHDKHHGGTSEVNLGQPQSRMASPAPEKSSVDSKEHRRVSESVEKPLFFSGIAHRSSSYNRETIGGVPLPLDSFSLPSSPSIDDELSSKHATRTSVKEDKRSVGPRFPLRSMDAGVGLDRAPLSYNSPKNDGTPKPIVPARRSSLRHFESLSSPVSSRRRSSRQFNNRKENATVPGRGHVSKNEQRRGSEGLPLTPGLDKRFTLPTTFFSAHADIDDGDFDPEVTRRIRELRAQKEERDRRRQEEEDRDIGLIMSAISGLGGEEEIIPPSSSTSVPIRRQSVVRSRPDSPASLLDMPINYNHALQSLEKPDVSSNFSGTLNYPMGRIPLSLRDPEKEDQDPNRVGADGTSSLPSRTKEAEQPPRRKPLPAFLRLDTSAISGLTGGLSSGRGDALPARSASFGGPQRPSDFLPSPLLFGNRSGQKKSGRRACSAQMASPTRPLSVEAEVEEYLNHERFNKSVRDAATGRIVCFSDVGDPDGHAVVCCVGMGLTRFVSAFYDALARELKLRLITPDRPGVGGSDPNVNGTPLSWPDDLQLICTSLGITRFSLLAHSAGAIYALATALRMPQHLRGSIQLLAPWIPPSQLLSVGNSLNATDSDNTANSPTGGGGGGGGSAFLIPKSQRILRALPTTILRVANSGLMAAAAAGNGASSLKGHTKFLAKPPKRRSLQAAKELAGANLSCQQRHGGADAVEGDISLVRRQSNPGPGQEGGFGEMGPHTHSTSSAAWADIGSTCRPEGCFSLASPSSPSPSPSPSASTPYSPTSSPSRQAAYDRLLTTEIWSRATQNASPLIDLLVCLERNRPVGFRYEDVAKPVIVRHGSKDSRVPVENVKRLGRVMKPGRWDVRVLEGEPHGLMARAAVMAEVFTEISDEWEHWERLTRGGR